MPSFIDELVVSLGLDSSQFRKSSAEVDDTVKKTKDNVRRSGADIEDSARKSTQSLQKLQGQVLLLFSAFTAGKGLKDFVQGLVQSNAALGRTAYTLDTTVQKLGTWVNAGEMVGATSQDIIGSFQSLTSQMQQFTLTGESTLLPYLRALGITAVNADGSMRDMGETLIEVHKRFQGMDPARAAEIGRGMGLTPGMINLLLQKGDALERMLAMGKKYAPTDADVKSATELAQAWNQMGMSSSAMGRTFLTEVTPALLGLIRALTAISDWLSAHPVALTIVLGALTAAFLALSTALTVGMGATAFTAVLTGFRLIGGLLPGLLLGLSQLFQVVLPGVSAMFLEGAVATSTFGGALWALLGPVALVAAAIAGIVYEIHQLITDSDSVERHAARLQFERDRAKAPRGDWRRDPLNATYREDGHYERVNGKAIFIKNPEGAKKPAAGATTTPANPQQLGDVIGKGEGSYNSVNLGQRGGNRSAQRDLPNMSVGEVMAAQQRGDFNAAGKYQLIKGTMSDAVRTLGIRSDAKFDQATQDRIFKDYILTIKRPEMGDYLSGKSNDLHAALLAWSKEFASATDPDTGQSHYAGVANNRASIGVDEMAAALIKSRAQIIGGDTNVAGNTTNNTTHNSTIQHAGAPQVAMASQLHLSSATHSSSSEINIREINVNVPSGDPKTIAGGIKDAIRRNSFVQQANSGQG